MLAHDCHLYILRESSRCGRDYRPGTFTDSTSVFAAHVIPVSTAKAKRIDFKWFMIQLFWFIIQLSVARIQNSVGIFIFFMCYLQSSLYSAASRSILHDNNHFLIRHIALVSLLRILRWRDPHTFSEHLGEIFRAVKPILYATSLMRN